MSKTYYALTSYGRGLYGGRDLWTEYRRRVLSKIQTVYLLGIDTGCILPCSVVRAIIEKYVPNVAVKIM